MKLKLETQINAICIINKDQSGVIMSKDMNMTFLDWVVLNSLSTQSVQTKLPANLLDIELLLIDSGISHTSEEHPFHYTTYKYEDDKIIIAVNVIDWIGDLAESN